MILKQCILYHNQCYNDGGKIKDGKPTGIVVHSTGSNNPNLCRYVQAVEGDQNWQEINEDIGKNKYNNHWNKAISPLKCVHAFIGKNAKGLIETYQTLPFDRCPWGSGSGNKGSYNKNPNARIQFEVQEDDRKSETYFDAVWREAIEFSAYICKQYNLTVDKICSHKEAHDAGMGSNHGDPDYWLKAHGKNMDWFRAEVKKLLDGEEPEPSPKPESKATVNTPGDTLNVREAGDYKVKKLGALEDQSTVEILESQANGWKKVRLEGWVNGDYLKGYTVNTPGDTLNVREAGDYKAKKLGALENRSTVEILESQANGWKKVKLEGWVNGGYLA